MDYCPAHNIPEVLNLLKKKYRFSFYSKKNDIRLTASRPDD